MKINPYENSCNYFKMFQNIRQGGSSEKSLGVLKVLSLATVIIPAIFGIVYFFSKPKKTLQATSLEESLIQQQTPEKTKTVTQGILKTNPSVGGSDALRTPLPGTPAGIAAQRVEDSPIAPSDPETALVSDAPDLDPSLERPSTLHQDLSELATLSSLMITTDPITNIETEAYSSLIDQIERLSDQILSAPLSELQSLNQSDLDLLNINVSKIGIRINQDTGFKYSIEYVRICQELFELNSLIQPAVTFAKKQPRDNSLVTKLPYNFFKDNNHWKAQISKLSGCSKRELELSIAAFQKCNPETLVHYTLPFINESESDEEKMEAFNHLIGILATIPEIDQLYRLMRTLNAPQTTTAPSLGLASSGAGQDTTYYSQDQTEYARRFMATVNGAADKISKGIKFDECLTYIAAERRDIAKAAKTPNYGAFGTPRRDYDDLTTPLTASYQKYLDYFLQSEKSGWKKGEGGWDPNNLMYTMSFQPEGSENPIVLTTINFSPHSASWNNVPAYNNTEVINAEANRLFDIAVNLPNPKAGESLEPLLKAVGELHWFLVHSAPFYRGSAAIAKMMIGAILKHHGVEAGGFGDLEPDCMALIQSKETFAEGYSNLMQYPPPRLITEESASSS